MTTPKRGRSKLGLAGLGCLALVGCCIVMAIIGSMLPKNAATPTAAPSPDATQSSRKIDTSRSVTVTPTITLYVSADGDGAYIRSVPDREAKVKVWPDGTKMILIERAPRWMG